MSLSLLTQPNTLPHIPLWNCHTLTLPPCCPISGNPQPGSYVLIGYYARGAFLEVYSLRKYIESFIGGREQIRDMEGMIQTLATDCAAAIDAPVLCWADIVLQRGDRMTVLCLG